MSKPIKSGTGRNSSLNDPRSTGFGAKTRTADLSGLRGTKASGFIG
jgi:hypothetical protein